ncbi:MAG: DEAD/DEAH box helicase [Rhodanobacteraceae bacterium]
MRVEIRDAEWRVRRVDHSSDGGHVLTCEGLSELVQGAEALFLDQLEHVHILEPERTELVDDTSSHFDASLLYIASLLRKSAASDAAIHLGDQAALDRMPYQLMPALQALAQPRQRILIADATGLGKTLEAGILVSELIARGRGKRILVLATKAMMGQFQQEFWNRFTIPLVRLDSLGLQRVRNRIPANHNPFHFFDRSIISIDTLKQDIEYRHYLEQAYWDIIVIDEAQNVADRGSHSQRARLAKLLAARSDTLIMLSATPHDGKPESFASLVNMLDPTAIANPHDYAREDFSDKGLVVRRFKKDIRDQLRDNFPDREIKLEKVAASQAEEAAFDRLMEVSFHTLDGGQRGSGQLFRTTLEKALFSSPAACLSTVENRMRRVQRKLERVRDEETRTTLIEDLDSLQGLQFALKAITPDQFSKYQLLKTLLQGGLQWSPSDTGDRLVVFTESLVTLEFLYKHLSRDLKLPKDAVAVLRGDMRDRELMDTVEQFNRRESPIRLLLCSDVASEGINLHHLSHRMIHFDIPWSLMVFQQRNGRIDRYGQTSQPQIRYLQTTSAHHKVRGDQRILEVLVEKDDMAGKNIGDPSEFLGVFDQQAEEERVGGFMETAGDGDDLWQQFLAGVEGQAEGSESPLKLFLGKGPVPSAESTQPLPRLFDSELEYAAAGLRWLAERGDAITGGIEGQVFWLQPPKDLEQRLNYLPPQIRPENNEFRLTADKRVIYDELERVRADEENVWPQLHYLWPLHPVMDWLTDRALHAFGRHAAPVLRLPAKLAADEAIVLVHGGYPNQRGYTLVQAWVGVHFKDGKVTDLLDWVALQDRLGLKPGQMPNRGHTGDTSPLAKLLPDAVAAARKRLHEIRAQFVADRKSSLDVQAERLQELKSRHQYQLQLVLDKSEQLQAVKASRKEQGQQQIERMFADHQAWLDNTQTIEDTPYLQVVAVFTGKEA